VDKIMNLIAEDRAMWLVHVQTWKNAKVIQKNVDEHWKEQPSYKVGDQVWLWRQHMKTIRPSGKLDHQRLCDGMWTLDTIF
jgi:hypothetical protein